jgi:hypothetical protein
MALVLLTKTAFGTTALGEIAAAAHSARDGMIAVSRALLRTEPKAGRRYTSKRRPRYGGHDRWRHNPRKA